MLPLRLPSSSSLAIAAGILVQSVGVQEIIIPGQSRALLTELTLATRSADEHTAPPCDSRASHRPQADAPPLAPQAENGDLRGAEKQWTLAIDVYENGGDGVVLSPQVLHEPQSQNPKC